MGFLHWLSECEAPTSIHSHNLSDSDVLREQNDSPDDRDQCPECGAVTDIDYGEVDKTLDTLDPTLDALQSFSVPFPVQEFLFESLAEQALDNLHNLIDDHYGIILKTARARFHRGYVDHGSEMYSWSPERRFEETLQGLASAVVYPTSGSLE